MTLTSRVSDTSGTPSALTGYRRPDRRAAYALAILLGSAAGLLTEFTPVIHDRTPFFFFFAAVVISSWYGGLGPGLVVTAISAVIVTYAVLPPAFSMQLSIQGLVLVSAFSLLSLLISVLSNAARRANEASALALLRERAARSAVELAVREKDEALALLDGLMAASPIGLALLDKELRFIRVNDAIASMNRAPKEAHLGRTVSEIAPGAFAKTESYYRTVLAEGVAVNDVELSLDSPDGSGRQEIRLASYYPVRHGDGTLIGIGVASVDITERTRTERALQASEARLANLFNSAMDAIITIDAQQRITMFNAAAERTFGCPAVDALGSDIERFIPDRYRSQHRNHVQTFGVTGITSQSMISPGTLYGLRDDGSEFPLEATISSFHEDDEIFYTVILRDVTERLQSEHEREHSAKRTEALSEASRLMAEQSLDLGAVLDSVTRFLGDSIGDMCVVRLLTDDGSKLTVASAYHKNPQLRTLARELLDVPQRADQGFSGRVFESGQPLLIPTITQAEIFGTAPSYFRSYAERIGTYSLMICPLRVRGRVIGVVGVSRDTPERPYTQDEFLLMQDLADRAALAIENARLFARTEQAVHQREEFVSIASHELRTPMTTVKGYVQLLNREMKQANPDPDEIAEFLDALQGQVERFELLVTDLLEASRAQRGRLDLRQERVDLADLARRVLNRFEHDTTVTNGHTLEILAPDPVIGLWDATRLDQVLTNLISNAVKYSPDGGTVRVEVRRRGDLAELRVNDQGVGIPPNELENLFQPFVRGAAGQNVGGTGLGLYITAQIVERHGGTIHVESTPGVGTSMIVRLPLGESEGTGG